jgi:hypothetical protein
VTAGEDDAPPAVPEWEPGELAKRIASGHAGSVHFPDVSADGLARTIQGVMDKGRVKQHGERLLYWDQVSGLAVLVNPADPDGGTAFVTDERYVLDWGDPEGV